MATQGEDLKYLTQDYWNRRYDAQDIPWQGKETNPVLVKYIRLLDGGKKDLKIFVPLCGKTLDMKWLFDLGHRVVGVDGFQKAIEDFFKENSMEYTIETKNGIPAFTEKSGRITLYCCNILDFQKSGEESFDAVWDRASFSSLNSGERARYVDLLTRLKKQNATQLLAVYEYDDRLHKGPPFSTPMAKVLEDWGERHNVELIDSEDVSKFFWEILKIDFKSFKECVYLLTLK